MQFLVDHIEFGFDEGMTHEEQTDALDDNIGLWDADDEADLIEEITAASGLRVESINCRHLLK